MADQTDVRDAEQNKSFPDKVRRKFVISSDSIDKLHQSAKLLHESTHTEEFFDTKDFRLSFNGMLLSHQNGSWNLRSGLTNAAENKSHPELKEMSSKPEIAAIFRSQFGIENFPDDWDLDALKEKGFREIEKVENRRATFVVAGDSEGMPAKVEVEQKSSGMNLAEVVIEQNQEKKATMDQMLRSVNKVKDLFEMESLGHSQYMWKYIGLSA